MAKQKYLQANKAIEKKLDKIADKYLDKISTKLITYYNELEELDKNNQDQILKKRPPLHIVTPTNEQKEILKKYTELEKELIDLLITMMGEVYKVVSKSLRYTYGDLKYPISKINFYNKDGLVLKDRLQKWLCPFHTRINPSKEDAEPYIDSYNDNFIIDKLLAIHQLDIIISTECSFQSETIKKDKLSGFCEWVEVCFGGGECHGGCETLCGEYPVNELIEPPFHPNCCCYTAWILSDDIEDVEDLDLEDDLDEEYYNDIDEELENIDIENAEQELTKE